MDDRHRYGPGEGYYIEEYRGRRAQGMNNQRNSSARELAPLPGKMVGECLGHRVEIEFLGLFDSDANEGLAHIASAGDPKGHVSIEVHIGKRKYRASKIFEYPVRFIFILWPYPANLSKLNEIICGLGKKLEYRHNIQLDWEALETALRQAAAPLVERGIVLEVCLRLGLDGTSPITTGLPAK